MIFLFCRLANMPRRNCLENSWIGLDRVFSVARSVDKGALRPVLPTRRRPRVESIRIYQTVSVGNLVNRGNLPPQLVARGIKVCTMANARVVLAIQESP